MQPDWQQDGAVSQNFTPVAKADAAGRERRDQSNKPTLTQSWAGEEEHAQRYEKEEHFISDK